MVHEAARAVPPRPGGRLRRTGFGAIIGPVDPSVARVAADGPVFATRPRGRNPRGALKKKPFHALKG